MPRFGWVWDASSSPREGRPVPSRANGPGGEPRWASCGPGVFAHAAVAVVFGGGILNLQFLSSPNQDSRLPSLSCLSFSLSFSLCSFIFISKPEVSQ